MAPVPAMPCSRGTPISGPIPVAFVIVDGGQEIRFMNTKYIVGTFTARRQ